MTFLNLKNPRRPIHIFLGTFFSTPFVFHDWNHFFLYFLQQPPVSHLNNLTAAPLVHLAAPSADQCLLLRGPRGAKRQAARLGSWGPVLGR